MIRFYGVFANTLAIILGSTLGIIFKKYIPKNLGDVLIKTVGLCVIYIGISGALKGENTLILIFSIVIGTIIGTLLKLEDRLNGFAKKIEKKFSKKDSKNSTFAEGFVASTLLFCIGAMAVVGSLQSGISQDNQMLYTKSTLDGITSIVLASTFGIGVMCSSVPILLYQGLIVLLSTFLAPILSQSCINEMTCVGSILILGIGLNMTKIGKFKIMDMLPSVFFPIIICQFFK